MSGTGNGGLEQLTKYKGFRLRLSACEWANEFQIRLSFESGPEQLPEWHSSFVCSNSLDIDSRNDFTVAITTLQCFMMLRIPQFAA